LLDSLGLSRRVNAALQEASDPTTRADRVVYVDAEELSGALRLTGRYRQEKETVVVDAYVLDGETERAHFAVQAPSSDLERVAAEIVKRAEEAASRASKP
jgi:hypothetical protein